MPDKKPFVPVTVASEITGLSQRFLRDGCRAGTIPHVLSGRKILINIPRLLRELGVVAEDRGSQHE